jgi:hypothetical protein
MRDLWFFRAKWGRENNNYEKYPWTYTSRIWEYKDIWRRLTDNGVKKTYWIYA